MASRFGRNKRRRARERIALLEAALEQQKNLTRANMQHYDNVVATQARAISAFERNEWLIIESLGMNTVFTRPKQTNQVTNADSNTFYVSPPLGGFDVNNLREYASLQKERSEVLMYVLRCAASVDKAKTAIHLMVRLGDTDASCYAISTEGLRILPEAALREIIANEVAPALADAAIKEIKRKGIRL